MAHFVNKCRHGRVVSQCRCMSKDKVVVIVPCGAACVPDLEAEVERLKAKTHCTVTWGLPWTCLCMPCRVRRAEAENERLRKEVEKWKAANRRNADKVQELEDAESRLRAENERLRGALEGLLARTTAILEGEGE